MRIGRTPRGFTLFALFLCCIFGLHAHADWPRWRGPNGDGISNETEWDPAALSGGPKILWKADIGIGYSNVALQEDRLYMLGTRDGNAALLCLDAETGKEIWRYAYKDPMPPQSTPIIDGGYVYALTTRGDIACVRAKNGKPRWAARINTDHTSEMVKYGYAQSPVIDGDLVILNANVSGIALNKASGKTVWTSEPYSPESNPDGYYATPVLYVHEGKRCALLFSGMGLFSVGSETGTKMWFYPWVTLTAIAADPIVFGEKIFVSSGKNADGRCALLKITGNAPAAVWQNNDMRNYFSTSLLVGEYLYGIDGDSEVTLRCMDIKTGAIMWKKETRMASLISADGKLIVLEEDGSLRIVEASPASYREIASAKLTGDEKGRGAKFWTPPALHKGRIYCRDFMGALYCVDARKQAR